MYGGHNFDDNNDNKVALIKMAFKNIDKLYGCFQYSHFVEKTHTTSLHTVSYI